jgi:hypothetical protein
MATQSDQTNTGVVTTIVIVGAFAMISISAMVTAMVRSEHAKLDGERPTNADLDTVAALDKSQLEHITAPAAWVAERGGKVHIPIERAMKLVVEEYRKDPAAASPPAPPGVNMTPPVAADAAPAAGAAPGAPAPAGLIAAPADPAKSHAAPPPGAPAPAAPPAPQQAPGRP